jgi:hypothetical protein
VSPLELVGDGFEQLATELRASKPVAPAALRERVADLGHVEPASPRWTFRPSRRLVLGLAGAALLASLVAAGVSGLSGSGDTQSSAGAKSAVTTTPGVIEQGSSDATARRATERSAQKAPLPAYRSTALDSLKPTPGRLQRYEATLRLRVKDVDALSNATRRAVELTRSLGGYVGSVSYATSKGTRGGATLVLRVPVGNVQAELAGLSSLGTILQQQTGVLDVTRRADTELRQIAKLERALAAADAEHAPAIRLKLRTLRAKHARLVRSAQLARITLGLTTPAHQAAAAPSRFDRTLDDAGAVLLRELEILLYALVVVGPLLLIGGAAVATARAQRRRADGRLLERS